MTDTVTQEQIVAYLEKQAPDIAKLVKNMTAGDVHQSTALGNEKAKPFKELIESKRKPLAFQGESEGEDGGDIDKAEWSIPFDVVKAAPDQQLIFGWASVAEKNGKLIIDKQDDVILPEELEKAAYDFVLYSRQQGDMHVKKGTGRLVESMIFTKEKQKTLGVDLGMVGWWVGFKVDDPALWDAHKRGERPEFSIGGRGSRVAL